MDLNEVFAKELNDFIINFSNKYNCDVGIRLPRYFEDILALHEVDLSHGIKLIPQFTPRQEKEKIESWL